MNWLARLKSLEGPKGDPREPSKPGSLGFQGCLPEPLQNTEAPPAPADANIANAEPWDDAAVQRFKARALRIRRRGFDEKDADDLAGRLYLRDVHADQRVMCLECRNLFGVLPTGWRCGIHKAAHLLAPAVGRDLATMFQDCPGFVPQEGRR